MPATGNFILDKSFDPQTLPITRYRFVKLNASTGSDTVGAKPQVVPLTANTDKPIGVAQEGVVTADSARGKGLPVRLEWHQRGRSGRYDCSERR